MHTIPLLLFTILIFGNIDDLSLSRKVVYNVFICWTLKRSHAMYSFDIDRILFILFQFNTGITSTILLVGDLSSFENGLHVQAI